MKQQLTEALAWDHELIWAIRNEAQFPKEADAGTELLRTILAAARLVERLLPGECRHGYLVDLAQIECPVCHGSGQVWDEGIVEAVREAIRSPLVEVVSIELEPSQFETALDEMARAVLSALVELLTEKSPSELEWLAARGKGGGH